jgi:hypothetical protein
MYHLGKITFFFQDLTIIRQVIRFSGLVVNAGRIKIRNSAQIRIRPLVTADKLKKIPPLNQ